MLQLQLLSAFSKDVLYLFPYINKIDQSNSCYINYQEYIFSEQTKIICKN